MSKPKHTPGPWLIQKVTLGDKEIKIVANGDEWKRLEARVSRDDCCEKTALANARLIASAPDMLAALESISSNPHCDLGSLVYKVRDSELEGWDGPAVIAWSNAVQSVKAAIAKAKGGQS